MPLRRNFPSFRGPLTETFIDIIWDEQNRLAGPRSEATEAPV